MFIGQEKAFTQSGNTLSIANLTVGALHVSITGYTQVRLQGTGGTLDKAFDLEQGYNILLFPNVALTAISATFTGTGTVDWANAKLYETEIDLTSEMLRHRPYNYEPTLQTLVPGEHSVHDVIFGELAFEWRYLDWEKVDVLESLFDRNFDELADNRLDVIPDGYEGERFRAVITSGFDFYPSVRGNFNSGASGALIFSTI